MSKRILIVDDNPSALKMCVNIVKKAYPDVVATQYIKEVLTEIIEGKFDLVLMDVQMPEMSGIEAVKKIRASESHHTNIIALTASIMAENKKNILAAGFDEIIGKPYSYKFLLQKIKEYL